MVKERGVSQILVTVEEQVPVAELVGPEVCQGSSKKLLHRLAQAPELHLEWLPEVTQPLQMDIPPDLE